MRQARSRECTRSVPGFFEQVRRLVRQVPPGRVTSYGAVARMLGNPRGARTVGWALRGLPAGSDVPWHRVVNGEGRVSTRCEECGINQQRELLEAEGVVFDEGGVIDMDRFGWTGLSWLELDELMHVDTIR